MEELWRNNNRGRAQVFFSGKEDKQEHGTGFLVHKDIMKTVLDVAQSPAGSSPPA